MPEKRQLTDPALTLSDLSNGCFQSSRFHGFREQNDYLLVPVYPLTGLTNPGIDGHNWGVFQLLRLEGEVLRWPLSTRE